MQEEARRVRRKSDGRLLRRRPEPRQVEDPASRLPFQVKATPPATRRTHYSLSINVHLRFFPSVSSRLAAKNVAYIYKYVAFSVVFIGSRAGTLS